MKIDTIINDSNNKFPKMMVNKTMDNLIVLFIEPQRGMVISKRPDHNFGYYEEMWNMNDFQDFTGEVKLTQ
jgi:hypothetical protein